MKHNTKLSKIVDQKQISNQDLKILLGCHITQVSHLLSGRRLPTYSQAKKIIQFCGNEMSLDDLLSDPFLN
ncbi:helix-turn-helix transcriptional regulator [Pseudoalteromonas sp.]|uniref:helix-turn-helix domain-containing protein n=1 Tax=Pseudoalteromonas sp. TaxID=53249 RepID=UPI002624AC3F|nr:helix-turn-helix transcriptional regulator [Pseudoalteromonas sp.]MCP4585373.1 helix-turn-helix transcriptional regulator [Pseudoalteromonas sp.]